MKIRTKLILVETVLLAIILILLFGVGSYQMRNLEERTVALQENYDAVLLAEQILVNIQDKAIRLSNIALSDKPEEAVDEMAAIKEREAATSQDILLLHSQMNTTETAHMVDNLEKSIDQYDAYLDLMLNLLSMGRKEEAIALINDTGKLIQDEIFQNVTLIVSTFETNMKTSLSKTSRDSQRLLFWGGFSVTAALLIVVAVLSRIAWRIALRLHNVSAVMLNVANGTASLSTRIEAMSEDEIGDVAHSFNLMANFLEERKKWEEDQLWMKSHVAEITKALSGKKELEDLARTYLSELAPLLEASHAVLYYREESAAENETVFRLLASYASREREQLHYQFRLGEGLIGQAALEKSPIRLTDVPPDYVKIRSGLGETDPLNLYVLPVLYNDNVNAVVEIATFKPFTSIQQDLLNETLEYLGITLENVKGGMEIAHLLEESQTQLEEIQAQSEELQSQQEELEQINEELRNKAQVLEEQKKELEAANNEITATRAELEERARQLATASQYKSEFLANTSHELRTPLNSLIILSKMLADNPEGNLTERQVEYATTIHSSGCDLLAIINDILDLSKIESGKMTINPDKVFLSDLIESVERRFLPVAKEKGIEFKVVCREGLPDTIYSDEQRLRQVLVNLLSNAFKFTEQGKVVLELALSDNAGNQIAFMVSDTGIGIPKEKQEIVFQAFQQADGTTSRKYGGTGLGLSISREIAHLLGGEIEVESEEGKGSKFTFRVGDYQEPVAEGNRRSSLGEAAITVDHGDHGGHGGTAAENELKSSEKEDNTIKSILIVDDDIRERNSLMELIGGKDVILTAVSTGTEAMEQLKVHRFDCIILDLGLSDITGFDLLEKLNTMLQKDDMKIFIYTGRDLTSKEELYLKKYAHSIIIKDACAPQRLMEELDLYLHADRETMDLDATGKEERMDPAKHASVLAGRKVLIVDDDARNVYALSSLLEMCGMTVAYAENGAEALQILQESTDLDLIIMDIMMPEMDGYETMAQIRLMPKYRDIPIIALTAKAMKEDRGKCIEAGASDYIAKPADSDQLISLIKVWLYREDENHAATK